MRGAALWTGLFLRLCAREFQIAALFILFPALLALVYAQSFGSSGFAKSLGAIVVAPSGAGGERAGRLAAALRAQAFEGRAAMAVYESTDLDASMRALRDGTVSLVIDASVPAGEDGVVAVPIYADPASFAAPYAESFARAAAAEAFADPSKAPPRWRATAAFIGGSGGANDFLLAVPGLFVFGWIFGAMTSALLVVRELRRRTLDRARLAESGIAGLMLGLWAAQCAIGLLQSLLLWAAAAIAGFPLPSRPLDAAIAVLVLDLLMAGLAAACGLATAAFADNEGTAVNLSMAFIAPLAFLSGAVFPIPIDILLSVGGYGISATDVLPSGPATRALTDVMVRGAGIASAWPAFLVAAIGTALYIAASGALFKARRLGAGGRTRWGLR